MNGRKLIELYADYLICTFGQASATNMSRMLDGAVSHDKITRMLSQNEFTSKDLWNYVKPLLRKIQTEAESARGKDAPVLCIDDTVEEKPYMDESELICWHFDHCQNKYIKGINMQTLMWQFGDFHLPISFDIVLKKEWKKDKKTGRLKRFSKVTKNELFRKQIALAKRNNVPFTYVLGDIWYASAENFKFIHQLGKYFVMPLKSNRKVALSSEDQEKETFQLIESFDLEVGKPTPIYLEGVDFPLHICKQVFKNEAGDDGILYLITNDLSLNYEEIASIYQKRWKIEEYHKSLKSNTAFSQSPAHTVRTQSNHIFGSILAFVKLEKIKIKANLNHFALKSKLYAHAIKHSFQKLIYIYGELFSV